MAIVQQLLGRYQEAREAIRRLLDIAPGFLPAAKELARLELRAGRQAEARALLAARPGGITPFWNGVLEHALGRPEPARQALEEVTRVAGHSYEKRNHFGRLK